LISQPWHNITYAAGRQCAVLAVLFHSDLLQIYRTGKGVSWE